MLTEKLDILNIFNELSEKTELFEKTGLQFVQTRVYMQQLNSDNFIQNRRIAVATIRSMREKENVEELWSIGYTNIWRSKFLALSLLAPW